MTHSLRGHAVPCSRLDTKPDGLGRNIGFCRFMNITQQTTICIFSFSSILSFIAPLFSRPCLGLLFSYCVLCFLPSSLSYFTPFYLLTFLCFFFRLFLGLFISLFIFRMTFIATYLRIGNVLFRFSTFSFV